MKEDSKTLPGTNPIIVQTDRYNQLIGIVATGGRS